MTVFCREPQGIIDLVSGAKLFSNKALIFKGISARMFYYHELWDRGLKSPDEPLGCPRLSIKRVVKGCWHGFYG